MKLVAYNFFGNGDLFDSRQFVLEWMRMLGVSTAQYAYQERYKGIFNDLPQIEWTPLTPQMNSQSSVFKLGDTLYVNTWVGRGWNGREDHHDSYVLNPGVGCVLENIFRMHDDMARAAGFKGLSRSLVEYIPTIDYSRLNLESPHRWLDTVRLMPELYGKRLVLICNGLTTSAQARNHDFSEALELIQPMPDVIFIVTDKCNIQPREDVVYSDAITQRQKGEVDLNAISYLSRHCEVIAGRCSGPHMTAQVLENWMDSTKTLLCFTHNRNGAAFIRYPEKLGLKMKVQWSPATEPRQVADEIRKALRT